MFLTAMLGWGIVAFLAGLTIAPAALRRREAFVLTATLVQLLFYVGSYYATPHDARWHVVTSWSRLTDPIALPYPGRVTLATFGCAVAWWMTQALPWAMAAMLPFVVFPAAGVMDITATMRLYGQPIFFWMMGTVLMGYAIEKHGLARRIAVGKRYLGSLSDEPPHSGFPDTRCPAGHGSDHSIHHSHGRFLFCSARGG